MNETLIKNKSSVGSHVSIRFSQHLVEIVDFIYMHMQESIDDIRYKA